MNKLICVDIQESMEKYFDFNISKFIDYLDNFEEILYIYDSSFNEDENNIIEWLINNGLQENTLSNFIFIEKEYGFFREAMEKFYNDDMINIIKKMIINNNYNEEIKGINIHLPSNFEELRMRLTYFKNSIIIGGGKNECLNEIILIMKALGLNYKENFDFIYD